MSTVAQGPLRTTEPSEYAIRVRITGAGAANPTNTLARGTAVTYLSATGKYRVTFDTRPGKTLTGISPGAFQSATPSTVAGFTAAFGAYVPPTSTARGYIDVWTYDATPALVDLTTAMVLNVTFTFSD